MIKVKFDDFITACILAFVLLAFAAGLVALIVFSRGWAIIPIVLVPLLGYAIAAWDTKRGRQWWE
jgi:hypothetical protein